MNRSERRRKQREGARKNQWDLIIAGGVGLVIIAVFASMFLFPNLNLATYQDANARTLRMIVNRGVKWLENDWQNVGQFAYAYHESDDSWPSFEVEKGAEGWTFTELGSDEGQAYAADDLPNFYKDLPAVLADLNKALGSKEFSLEFQQTNDYFNVVTLIRRAGDEDAEREQYVLAFDHDHHLEQVIYYSTIDGGTVGYSFADLYDHEHTAEQ